MKKTFVKIFCVYISLALILTPIKAQDVVIDVETIDFSKSQSTIMATSAIAEGAWYPVEFVNDYGIVVLSIDGLVEKT